MVGQEGDKRGEGERKNIYQQLLGKVCNFIISNHLNQNTVKQIFIMSMANQISLIYINHPYSSNSSCSRSYTGSSFWKNQSIGYK